MELAAMHGARLSHQRLSVISQFSDCSSSSSESASAPASRYAASRPPRLDQSCSVLLIFQHACSYTRYRSTCIRMRTLQHNHCSPDSRSIPLLSPPSLSFQAPFPRKHPLGGATVRRGTRDRKVDGSTPGRGAIKSTKSTQPSIRPA